MAEYNAMSAFLLFGDESHAGRERNPQTGFYVVAGWLGSVETWTAFDRVWRCELEGRHLSEFHMGPCEKGSGDFRGCALNERRNMQQRFINIINQHELSGVICSVALSPFRKFEPKIREHLAAHLQHLLEPHVLGAHGLTVAATRAAAAQGIPETKKISFVLDRQIEFAGRLEELWTRGSLQNDDMPRHSYFGDFTHAPKHNHPGIQAADILAYEEFRRLSGDRKRWQMQLLSAGRQPFHREIMNQAFMKIAVQTLKISNSTV